MSRHGLSPSKVGFWQMWRDIGVSSILKGQFPIFILGAMMIALIIRLPGDDLARLANRLLDQFIKGGLVSYVLNIMLGLGWVMNTRWLRQMHSEEIKRMSEQQTKWQEATSPTKSDVHI